MTPSNRRSNWYGRIPKPGVRFWRWAIWLFIALLLIVSSIVGIYLWQASRFDLQQISKPPQGLQAFDFKGNRIGIVRGGSSNDLSFAELPKPLIDALLAREDERFFEHEGLDYQSIIRSSWRNLLDTAYTQGGSTLTMQLARNSFGLTEKTLNRKLLEIALACRIERNFSKEEIITTYLNRMYFGAGCHGISEAAENFFGKSVHELNIPECAMLIGILRGPSILNPRHNFKAALKQRSETLDRMVDAEKLTPAQAAEANAIEIKIVEKKEESNEQPLSYSLDWLRRDLEKIPAQSSARINFLNVLSFFDLPSQQFLESTISIQFQNLRGKLGIPLRKNKSSSRLQDKNLPQLAVICCRTHSGQIISTTGGRILSDGKNRWHDLSVHLGLGFSPLVNASAASQNKLIINERPAQTASQTGINSVLKLAGELGLKELPEGDDLPNGNFRAPLAVLPQIFLTVFNEGVKTELKSIQKIVDYQGNNVWVSEVKSTQVMPAGSAKLALKFSPYGEPKHSSQEKPSFANSVSFQLPKNNGYFQALIGPKFSVFAWIGFDEPIEIKKQFIDFQRELICQLYKNLAESEL